MNPYPQRQPPRFVPTLTQVVAGEEQGAAAAPAASAPIAPPPARPVPPVAPAAAIPPVAARPVTPPPTAVIRDAQVLQQLEDRLMARIQGVVEEKIAAMVQRNFPVLIGAMTREMLREIQPVVRQALQEINKP